MRNFQIFLCIGWIYIQFTMLLSSANAQTYIVYKDDDMFSSIVDTVEKPNMPYCFDVMLKNNLPDGNYCVYNTNRPSGKIQDTSAFLLLKGKYVDSLKEGRFEYYKTSPNGKTSILRKTESYSEGLLEGSFFEYSPYGKIYEGFYSEGEKDGFFIQYNDSNTMESISYYKKGVELSWVHYENGKVIARGQYIEPDSIEEKYYDNKGNIWAYFLYKNGKILKIIEFYSNGNIKWSKEGEFLNSNFDNAVTTEVLLLTPLVSGVYIEYDESGKIVNRVNQ